MGCPGHGRASQIAGDGDGMPAMWATQLGENEEAGEVPPVQGVRCQSSQSAVSCENHKQTHLNPGHLRLTTENIYEM